MNVDILILRSLYWWCRRMSLFQGNIYWGVWGDGTLHQQVTVQEFRKTNHNGREGGELKWSNTLTNRNLNKRDIRALCTVLTTFFYNFKLISKPNLKNKSDAVSSVFMLVLQMRNRRIRAVKEFAPSHSVRGELLPDGWVGGESEAEISLLRMTEFLQQSCHCLVKFLYFRLQNTELNSKKVST